MIWNCRDKKIEYGNKTVLMGIVNVTPDSFSDGGSFFDEESAVLHALELIDDGADIIDLGAQSTRPGYNEISPEEEWERLASVLPKIREKTDIPISVDTYFPYVAEKALQNGADIINDVSGIINPKMAEIIKKSGAGWVLMHSSEGSCSEVGEFFRNAEAKCLELGINKNQLCFDMGIGFGKSYEQNLELIANIGEYKLEGYPLLLGVSRKRVIGKSSNQENPKERIFGNIAADTVGILNGADIIRLHDVKNEKQGIKTAEELKKWIK
ncbi:MAG: dihydropteroate synthase [Ruminococcaceae bacterium]|nr:dihydropteroate synthase [Oscillospiraceae bacterium]